MTKQEQLAALKTALDTFGEFSAPVKLAETVSDNGVKQVKAVILALVNEINQELLEKKKNEDKEKKLVEGESKSF